MSFLSNVVIPMTLSLHSSSPYSLTQTIDAHRSRMFSNVALNSFCQSTFDESFVVDEIGVPSIDENDIVDDYMLESDIFLSRSRRRKKEKASYVVDEFRQPGGSGTKGT